MATSRKIIQREKRHKRIQARLMGTAQRPRLVVHRSLKYHYAQLMDDLSGKTIVTASDVSKNNKSKAKGKIARAKEVGIALAKKAAEKNIKKCVFDRAGYKYHGRVKAVADGAREGGLQF